MFVVVIASVSNGPALEIVARVNKEDAFWFCFWLQVCSCCLGDLAYGLLIVGVISICAVFMVNMPTYDRAKTHTDDDQVFWESLATSTVIILWLR